MRDVIISDYACTDAICNALVHELWPANPPLVLRIPATGFSDAHTKWVEDFRASHGGRFLEPFIAQKLDPAQVRSISLIGFSAGCWGVREILSDPSDAKLVSFVYACDGLHGQYQGSAVRIQKPWIDFASRAAAGNALMVVSFSAIQPPNYPGTWESAIALGKEFGAAWPVSAFGPFVRCLPSCDVPGAVGAQEWGQAGNLVLVGSWPEGSAGKDAAAHVYQANTVQAAVWRTYLAPWLKQTPIVGVDPAGKRTGSTIGAAVAAIGGAAFGTALWYAFGRGENE